MRTREEIEDDAFREIDVNSVEVKMHYESLYRQEAILEVLLDIRELLLKENIK